jgi:glycerol-3-phosphate acyltransferase PlsX
MRVALDAMGGDRGSRILVQGAAAAAETGEVEVSLVGAEDVLRQDISALSLAPDVASRLHIVHASEVVEMCDNPVNAIRKKKDASVLVAFQLVKKGEACAAISAGNSGATMAAGIRTLGRLEGVSRPGITSIFPTLKKPVVLMDIGANVDCKPHHLLQFAVMASSYSQIMGLENPRVGLLTIGEEAGKGNALVKETWPLLKQSSLNFIGNVEGRDVFRGDVDVIVCDGFVGNICLKMSEGFAEAAMTMIRDEINSTLLRRIGGLLAYPAFKSFRKRVNYEQYGGAPLLGVDGIGIVCHGKSSAEAIKNALLQGAAMAKGNMTGIIQKSLAVNNGARGAEV